MKFSKYFLIILMSLIFINLGSSMVTYSQFDNHNKELTIEYGKIANFQVDFFSMNPPMKVRVDLVNTENKIIYTFLDKEVNLKEYNVEYGITRDIYETTGTFKIIISGKDKLNYVDDELTLTIKPDLTDVIKPKVSIISPEEGKVYNKPVKFLNFIAEDENLYKCQYSTNKLVERVEIPCSSGKLATATIESSEGVNKWTIYAIDKAGNIGTKEVNFEINTSIEEDKTAPVITIISPKDKTYSEKKLTFEITTDEDSTVSFSLNGKSKIEMSNPYDHVFTYNISLSDKKYTIVFYATDKAGNTATKSIEFKVDYKKDTSNKKLNELENLESDITEKKNTPNTSEPVIIYLNKKEVKPSSKQVIENFFRNILNWIKSLFS